MSKPPKGNHSHLTLSDRIFIEQELGQGSTFYSIAQVLHKDPTTISKEVKRSRNVIAAHPFFDKCRLCWNYRECREHNICATRYNFKCHKACRFCYGTDPTKYCAYFVPYSCHKTAKAPFVCNSCDHFNACPLEKARYVAADAQEKYDRKLVESRSGINLTLEELQKLNDLVSPLVLNGQPLSHVFAVHADEIPVCRRTLYNYFDRRVFQARNIDLPRRVRYKKRKKRVEPKVKSVDQIYRNKRTYKDFEFFMEHHPDLDVVEMDTVKGGRASGKCLLTLLFRSCSFMLIILLPKCTQECVTEAINTLYGVLGPRLFKKHFPVILTDNGPEFKDPWSIESTADGKRRTYVFYCDPYVSNQKARLEKNHEYIRYVIPKGRSMYRYSQKDVNLMASHINSTARDSLNGACPFDLANLLLDKRIPALTGQVRIAPDAVCLKPSLINRQTTSGSSSGKGGDLK